MQTNSSQSRIVSLPGFLIASKVLEKFSGTWELPEFEREKNFDLHRDILTAWKDLQTYDRLVKRLAYICEPNSQVFGSFKDVLTRAHFLLGDYWRAIQDGTISIKKRKQISLQYIQQLEMIPNIDSFYEELSKCINVDRLLRDLETPPSLFTIKDYLIKLNL